MVISLISEKLTLKIRENFADCGKIYNFVAQKVEGIPLIHNQPEAQSTNIQEINNRPGAVQSVCGHIITTIKYDYSTCKRRREH